MALTRRRLLAGGGAGAAFLAAGGLVAGLSRQGDDGSGAAPGPSETSPTATPTADVPRGGTARIASPSSFDFDTFDALRSGKPAVLEVLARTHARLLDWVDPAAATLGSGLASSWSQPEQGRVVLHLDPRATWQPSAAQEASPVTTEDVRHHLERAVSLAQAGQLPALQRPDRYLAIERVVAHDDGSVEVRLRDRDVFFSETLAARFALVQPPRAVDAYAATWHEMRPETATGAGPFVFRGRTGGTLAFDAFSSSTAPPFLDSLEVSEPEDVANRFAEKLLDEVILRDRRDAAPLIEARGGEIAAARRYEDSPVISSVAVDVPPWNNPLLRRALSAALNRAELARRLFGGRAAASGPVPPAHEAFALPEAELAGFDGYRATFEEDAREARKLWEAAGGPGLGALTVDIPAIFDPAYAASLHVPAMLREALGLQVEVRVDSYTAIAGRVAAGGYGRGRFATWFGWGPALMEPDPSRSLLETYHSKSSTGALLGIDQPDVDRLLDSLASAEELNERKETVKQVQRLLLGQGGAGFFTWGLQWSDFLRWKYLQGPAPTPFAAQHRSSQYAIDAADPSYAGRPS